MTLARSRKGGGFNPRWVKPPIRPQSLTPVVDPSSLAFWCILAHVSASISNTKRGFEWSGRRASNPLPRPWQGRALPSELLPLGPGQRIDFTRPAPPALRATSPQVGEELHINQAVWGSGHCVTRRPQRSRRAFTLIAESCSFVRSRRPDSTAALTAAIALTS